MFLLFFLSDITAKATRVLLALVIPGHLIFMYTISYMKAGHTSITWTFATFYLTASMLQVFNIFSWGNQCSFYKFLIWGISF
jgi:solute carrier family 41